MNFSNISVEMIAVILAFVLGIVCFVTIIIMIIALCKLKKLRQKVEALTRGKDAQSMEETILKFFERIEKLENHEEIIHDDIKKIKNNLKTVYQKTGIVKYDAFREMSGALSYSVALLDKENNGVLISSMYSREGCYSYAKEILHGKCELTLSEEEAEALNQAIAK